VERVDDRGRGIRDQDHVRLGDLLKATNRGAVEAKALLERLLLETVDRQRDVLPGAGEVGELEVHHPDPVLARHLEHVSRLRLGRVRERCTVSGVGNRCGHGVTPC
jgi:hypothetical protein